MDVRGHQGGGTKEQIGRASCRERVTCGGCGKEMAAGSLDSHCMTQHGKARERKWAWTNAATGGEEQQTYRMEFPKGGTTVYADDGMFASSDPRWLQWAFTQLVGLFNRVGLKTNCKKR